MSRDLREARMSLAQAVTRSLDADTASNAAARAAAGRAAADHRVAAALRLRRAGHDDLAQRLFDDTVTDASARAEMREVMQLVDAELQLDADAMTDGGRQASERRHCETCGSPMRVVPDSGIETCLPCRRGEADD